MKTFDIIIAALLIIGGLNWGLVGFFGFDLVGALLGDTTVASRAVYGLGGLAAVYQALGWRSIQRRWNVTARDHA